jgi:SAM-dependent methyltransferase
MARYTSTTDELDEAERFWWTDNGDLEEQYCWVQNPRQQRILRRGYIRAITAALPPGSRLLELGCGTGWLTLLLAEAGMTDLVGVDFSADQIARAQRNAKDQGLDDRVEFVVAGPETLPPGQTFDAVIMHAFLHHLTTAEIRSALAEAGRRLATGGRLVLLEPVHFADGPARGPLALSVLRRLESFPRLLLHRGARRAGPEERDVRRRLGDRAAAVAPFGPSPKEIPFEAGELEDLLGADFVVDERRPVLSMAHLVAQELLISALSQPRLWRAVERPVLTLASVLDRRFVGRPVLPSNVWVFQLYLCTKRPR